jgi:hypothetical protein
VKKRAIAFVFGAFLVSSPVHAKTFVGVLWPMFGPLPAIGLVELVGELKMMPDVEVTTYRHQEWPSLVKDMEQQPPGTWTVVIGYSLGANASVFVANNAKFVDLIIALQPSMLSWNPPLTGRVGHLIEIYNPNPWETFGGMGSKKLLGPNIEYIANHDSHPGAQFDPQFRDLVKSEIAKITAKPNLEIARAGTVRLVKLPKRPRPPPTAVEIARVEKPAPPRPPKPEPVAEELPVKQRVWATFLDRMSNSVDCGALPAERRLTTADMIDYAQRTYQGTRTADDFAGRKLGALFDPAAGGASMIAGPEAPVSGASSN